MDINIPEDSKGDITVKFTCLTIIKYIYPGYILITLVFISILVLKVVTVYSFLEFNNPIVIVSLSAVLQVVCIPLLIAIVEYKIKLHVPYLVANAVCFLVIVSALVYIYSAVSPQLYVFWKLNPLTQPITVYYLLATFAIEFLIFWDWKTIAEKPASTLNTPITKSNGGNRKSKSIKK